NENGVDISANKCWFNSVMLNLYNSKTFHKVINDLQKQSHDKTMPSYWIQQIFNDIRSGEMKKYGDHLQGLLKGMEEVYSRKWNKKYAQQRLSKLTLGEEIRGLDAYRELTEAISAEGSINNIATDIESIIEITRNERCDKHNWRSKTQVHQIDVTNKDSSVQDAYERHKQTQKDELPSTCKKCGSKIQEYARTISKIPQLLVFYRNCFSTIRTPSELQLKAEDGIHKYKLIGCVDRIEFYDKQCETQIRTDNDWFRIIDRDEEKVKNTMFNESSEQRDLAFYEEEK
ncbi:MAG: hypothetical protein IJS10_01410, partial [Alphaproteobacteria bacterium]|nr:hypothetical protein [Alphaproteobacteria bacterium]